MFGKPRTVDARPAVPLLSVAPKRPEVHGHDTNLRRTVVKIDPPSASSALAMRSSQ
jgi:hypothetical protein